MRCVAALLASLAAAQAGELQSRVTLEAGWARNPFFDSPVDGRGGDDAALFGGVAPGLRLDLFPDADDRLRLDGDATWLRYQGDVDATAWEARLATSWRHALSEAFAVEATAGGSGAADQRDPQDGLWLGTGGVRLRWAPGRVAVAGGVEGGGRRFPDRVGLAGDPHAPELDLLLRGRLELEAGPFRPGALWTGARYDALRLDSNVAAVDGVLHEGEIWIDHDLGGPGWQAWAQGWWRGFTDSRRDFGGGAGARLRYALGAGVEVGAAWSVLASWSNAEAGRWRQQIATVDVTGTWSGSWGEASVPPPAPAVPVAVPGGWRFTYRDAKARSVDLVGTFNEWKPGRTPLTGPDPDGIWTVVVPLPPGRNAFQFVIDGTRWVAPEGAPGYEDDGFGRRNAVVYVTEADRGSP